MGGEATAAGEGALGDRECGAKRGDTWPLDPLGLAHSGSQKSRICKPGFPLLGNFRKQSVVLSQTFQNTQARSAKTCRSEESVLLYLKCVYSRRSCAESLAYGLTRVGKERFRALEKSADYRCFHHFKYGATWLKSLLLTTCPRPAWGGLGLGLGMGLGLRRLGLCGVLVLGTHCLGLGLQFSREPDWVPAAQGAGLGPLAGPLSRDWGHTAPVPLEARPCGGRGRAGSDGGTWGGAAQALTGLRERACPGGAHTLHRRCVRDPQTEQVGRFGRGLGTGACVSALLTFLGKYGLHLCLFPNIVTCVRSFRPYQMEAGGDEGLPWTCRIRGFQQARISLQAAWT